MTKPRSRWRNCLPTWRSGRTRVGLQARTLRRTRRTTHVPSSVPHTDRTRSAPIAPDCTPLHLSAPVARHRTHLHPLHPVSPSPASIQCRTRRSHRLPMRPFDGAPWAPLASRSRPQRRKPASVWPMYSAAPECRSRGASDALQISRSHRSGRRRGRYRDRDRRPRRAFRYTYRAARCQSCVSTLTEWRGRYVCCCSGWGATMWDRA